jgi:hypothetical protein
MPRRDWMTKCQKEIRVVNLAALLWLLKNVQIVAQTRNIVYPTNLSMDMKKVKH